VCSNYAIKGTSVETLDSSELSSGASVPYFGCYVPKAKITAIWAQNWHIRFTDLIAR
jgi:hypothetical protein